MDKELQIQEHVQEHIKAQLYQQQGGVVSLIATIGMFIMQVVANLLIALGNLAGAFFKIIRISEYPFYDFQKGWEIGLFWKFLVFSVKSALFVLIFCIGGPVVILIGIFYLYKNLFEKFGERNQYEEEILVLKQKAQNIANANESNNQSE